MNLFYFTLRYVILEWGKKFMQFHSGCTFLELEAAFCKRYRTIQNDDKAFRVIKQGNDEKVKVYYEWIFKLANYLQHKADDILLTTFFQARLVPYLWIIITGMKQDTLFEHKEYVVAYEKIMANVEEYWKLWKP